MDNKIQHFEFSHPPDFAILGLFFLNTPNSVLILSAERRILSTNLHFNTIFGYAPSELTGRRPDEIYLANATPSVTPDANNIPIPKDSNYLDNFLKHKNGRLIPVRVGAVPIQTSNGSWGTLLFVTPRLELASTGHPSMNAIQDALTGLPNRSLFIKHLGQAIHRRSEKHGEPFVVFILDLDRFKGINESLGYTQGDQLLKEIAKRIASCLGPKDTLARLAGDEFAVLLEEVKDGQTALALVSRIQKTIERPFSLDTEVHVSASAGLVLFIDAYRLPEDLLRDADIALSQAKSQGKGMCKVFNRKMREQVVLSLHLETELRNAMPRHELFLQYQPIITMATGQLTGFEALVRWNHPSRGLLPPQAFIPMAEDSGLIVPLGKAILKDACSQLAQWRDSLGALDLFISVNISTRQLIRGDIVTFLLTILDEKNLPPQALRLEITESALLNETSPTPSVLKDLASIGVQIGIDDFGKGYSSLNYLSQLPIDFLKIDKSFIRGRGDLVRDTALVKTIIAMGRALGMEVVAEGVETAQHVRMLKDFDCDSAQGFHICRPLDRAKAQDYILSAA